MTFKSLLDVIGNACIYAVVFAEDKIKIMHFLVWFGKLTTLLRVRACPEQARAKRGRVEGLGDRDSNPDTGLQRAMSYR